jgi:uncharacterized protein YkwD
MIAFKYPDISIPLVYSKPSAKPFFLKTFGGTMKRITYFLLIAALFVLQACSSSGEAMKPGLIPPIASGDLGNSALAGAANAAFGKATLPTLCSGAQDANATSFAVDVIRLVNVERAKAGVGALTNQPQLTQSSQKHSIDMGCKFFLSHTGSDGTSPFDRMIGFGYPYATAAENVAAGYATPAEVVTVWMSSDPHRKNILKPDFTEIGIGYVYNPGDSTKYYHYWTMDLGAQ